MNQHNNEWNVFQQFNHTESAISSIAFNQDGTKIAVGFGKNGYDSRLNIWRWNNQDWIFEQSVSALNEMPKSIFFFKNDETLIVGAQESTIRQFTKSSQNKWENQVIGGHSYSLSCMIYLKEQNKIVTCGGDWQLLSYEFKQNTWYLHQKLNGHKGKVNYICSNHDETKIASGGDDKSIIIWERKYNLSNNFYFYEQNQIIDGFEDRVWVLSFAKQEILASGELNGKIKIFVKTFENKFECIQSMKAHDRYVQSLKFNSDEIPILVSGGSDGSIKIWEKQLVGEAWRVQQQVQCGSVTCIAFSGEIMAVGTGNKVVIIKQFQ